MSIWSVTSGPTPFLKLNADESVATIGWSYVVTNGVRSKTCVVTFGGPMIMVALGSQGRGVLQYHLNDVEPPGTMALNWDRAGHGTEVDTP